MRWLALLLPLLLAAPLASAHVVVVAGPGDSLENATELPPAPARVFDELAATGGLHYYKMRFEAGATVRIRLAAGEGAFADLSSRPLVLIAGPGLPNDSYVPPGVALPEGVGQADLFGGQAQPQRAAWLPARLDVVVDGTWTPPVSAAYHLVVYSAEGGGPFALWIEPEEGIAWVDWFSMPSLRAAAHEWQGGAALSRYLAGGLAAAAVAAPLAWRARGRGAWSAPFSLTLAAAALFAASAGVAALLAWRAGGAWAWGPALVAAAAAAGAAGLTWRGGPLGMPRRLAAAAVGLAGFAGFAGFLWGPVALVAAAILPDDEPTGERV